MNIIFDRKLKMRTSYISEVIDMISFGTTTVKIRDRSRLIGVPLSSSQQNVVGYPLIPRLCVGYFSRCTVKIVISVKNTVLN